VVAIEKERPAKGGLGWEEKIKRGEVGWFNQSRSFVITTSPP
jgi:hypothetical protein